MWHPPAVPELSRHRGRGGRSGPAREPGCHRSADYHRRRERPGNRFGHPIDEVAAREIAARKIGARVLQSEPIDELEGQCFVRRFGAGSDLFHGLPHTAPSGLTRRAHQEDQQVPNGPFSPATLGPRPGPPRSRCGPHGHHHSRPPADPRGRAGGGQTHSRRDEQDHQADQIRRHLF